MIVGVMCAFFLTVSMTPAIMKLTNYSRHKSEGWKSIAVLSTKQWKAILLVLLLTTSYSIARIAVMDQDIKGSESAPEDRLKPAAKDLDVLDVMNWTQGEINNLSVTNRNSNELINVSAFSIVDFFKSAHITIALDDLDGETQFEFDGSFWDFLHSEFFGDDYVWIDINPLYSSCLLYTSDAADE